MASEEVEIYHWESKYLDDTTLEEFIKLELKEQAGLVSSSFSNLIKYGLNVAPRDDQQAEFIYQIDDAIATNEKTDISVRSGHGTGKTTILSWLIIYVGIAFDDAKIPTTAPVAAQLENMLIPEVRKWANKLFPPIRGQVEVQAQDVKFNNGNKCFARTARKDNTEALAGVHASFVLYVVDEASGIDQAIFNVIEGALTGENYLLVMTSNPTKTVGAFFESHNKNRSNYRTIHMDSEKSANVDPTWIKKMEDKYGRDSDTFRVRVQGKFPMSNTDSLFTTDEILESMKRDPNTVDQTGAVVYAADVARFGNDSSVLTIRNGYYMHTMKVFNQLSTMEYANVIGNEVGMQTDPHALFIDSIGVGAGVFDRLKEKGYRPTEANAAMRADEVDVYHNKRAEMYFNLKEWIRKGGILPDDEELLEELVCITYSYTNTGKVLLAKKEDIKEELGRSPDKGDACALSFFSKVRADRTHFSRPVQIQQGWSPFD